MVYKITLYLAQFPGTSDIGWDNNFYCQLDSRYDRFDWWRWKRRAAFRFIRYALTLCAAKILILIM